MAEGDSILKKSKFFLALLTLGLLMASQCHKEKGCHDLLNIENRSSNTIYYYFSYEYPDTSIVDYNPSLAGDYYKIDKNTAKSHYKHSGCFDPFVIDGEKLQVFIFSAETLVTLPWDTIIKNYLILKRFDLQFEELQNNKWTIVYE